MEKQLNLNSQYNSIGKGANEIFGSFKRETKNRNGGSSLCKALLRPVKLYGLQFWCSYVQKNMEKYGKIDVQERDTGIIHKLKEMP